MALPRQIEESVQRQGEELLETGQRFDSFDQIRQRHFWSSHLFKPDLQTGYISAGTYQLFSTPPGQSGQGYLTPLTELETNWKSSNRVPDNQNFEITELGVSMWSVPRLKDDGIVVDGSSVLNSVWMLSGHDAVAMAENTVIAITYLTNQVELGMVSDYAQASAPAPGIYEPNLAMNQDQEETPREQFQRAAFSSNGFPGPALRRRLKIPILLQHGETFTFTFVIPRPIFIFPVERAPDKDPQPRYVQMRFDFWATESFAEKS